MDEYASARLEKYNSTKHSSTKLPPNEAHDDKNHMDVTVKLTRREKNTRKYVEIKENDTVKIFTKGRGNYTDRKETTSTWSKENYKVRKIEYDPTGNRTFHHEILKV